MLLDQYKIPERFSLCFDQYIVTMAEKESFISYKNSRVNKNLSFPIYPTSYQSISEKYIANRNTLKKLQKTVKNIAFDEVVFKQR